MATRNGNAPRESAFSENVAERLPHRSRSFNIANLPNDIREQLNLRLLEGESGKELAAWLNALPAVQSVMGLQFNGSDISEVNLTYWRQGGYLQWLTERECFDSARALADSDSDLADTGLSAERLLNVLTLRYGQLLMRWDSAPDESLPETAAFSELARKARILQGISRSVLAIHRIQSQQSSRIGVPAGQARRGARNSDRQAGETAPLEAASDFSGDHDAADATSTAKSIPITDVRAYAPNETPPSIPPTAPAEAASSLAQKLPRQPSRQPTAESRAESTASAASDPSPNSPHPSSPRQAPTPQSRTWLGRRCSPPVPGAGSRRRESQNPLRPDHSFNRPFEAFSCPIQDRS